MIHLRNFGFSESELVKVFKTIGRPIADYCSIVYHSMLTDQMDERLERCQMHALRCIFGFGVSYCEMRRRAGITTLRQRRFEQTDKFAVSCTKSDRFSERFQTKATRTSGRRGGEKYVEKFARCKRLQVSPLFYMRRRLNGKIGKEYGRRNHERRERVMWGALPPRPGRTLEGFSLPLPSGYTGKLVAGVHFLIDRD